MNVHTRMRLVYLCVLVSTYEYVCECRWTNGPASEKYWALWIPNRPPTTIMFSKNKNYICTSILSVSNVLPLFVSMWVCECVCTCMYVASSKSNFVSNLQIKIYYFSLVTEVQEHASLALKNKRKSTKTKKKKQKPNPKPTLILHPKKKKKFEQKRKITICTAWIQNTKKKKNYKWTRKNRKN